VQKQTREQQDCVERVDVEAEMFNTEVVVQPAHQNRAYQKRDDRVSLEAL